MGRVVETTVTKLQMTARPVLRPPPKPHGMVALLEARDIPVPFFRYLYHEVGHPWHWVERKRMDDGALRDILQADDLQIYVLYVDGVPAGFAEISWNALPDTAELRYFGLTPDYSGRKLGPFFLDQVLDLMWGRGPDRLIVDTCTLDHPKALPLYQRFGFTPYAQEVQRIELLD